MCGFNSFPFTSGVCLLFEAVHWFLVVCQLQQNKSLSELGLVELESLKKEQPTRNNQNDYI